MRILTILFFVFLLSYRLDAADDGAGPFSTRPNTVNPGTEPHQPALSPVVVRSTTIQKQVESIEVELSILRATVRDPHSDFRLHPRSGNRAARGAIEPQEGVGVGVADAPGQFGG